MAADEFPAPHDVAASPAHIAGAQDFCEGRSPSVTLQRVEEAGYVCHLLCTGGRSLAAPSTCWTIFPPKAATMTLSAKSLYAKGSISPKEMAKLQVLRGSKSQPSKMAPFEQKTKDEGHQRNKGIPEMRVDQINNKRVQDSGGSYGTSGKREPPSKGGRAGPEGQTHVNEINRADYQKPKFPSGGNVKASNPKTGNTKMKAKRKQQSLPMYGKFGGRPA
jgi:hypothetical protein